MSDRNFAAVEANLAQSKAADKQQVLLEMIRAIAASDAHTLQKHLAEDVRFDIYGFPGLEGPTMAGRLFFMRSFLISTK